MTSINSKPSKFPPPPPPPSPEWEVPKPVSRSEFKASHRPTDSKTSAPIHSVPTDPKVTHPTPPVADSKAAPPTDSKTTPPSDSKDTPPHARSGGEGGAPAPPLPIPESLLIPGQELILLLVIGDRKEGGYKIQSGDGKQAFSVIRSFESIYEVKELDEYLLEHGLPCSYFPIIPHHAFMITKHSAHLKDKDYQSENIAKILSQFEETDADKARKEEMDRKSRKTFDRRQDDSKGSGFDRRMTALARLRQKVEKRNLPGPKVEKKMSAAEKIAAAVVNDDWWKSKTGTSTVGSTVNATVDTKSSGMPASVDEDGTVLNRPAHEMKPLKPDEKLQVFSVADRAREMLDAGIIVDCRNASAARNNAPVSQTVGRLADHSTDGAGSEQEWKRIQARKERDYNLFHLPPKFRAPEPHKHCLVQFVSADSNGKKLEEPIIVLRGTFATPEDMHRYRDRFLKIMMRKHPDHFLTHFSLIEMPTNVLSTAFYDSKLVGRKQVDEMGADNDGINDETVSDKKEAMAMKNLMEQSLVREEDRASQTKAGATSDDVSGDTIFEPPEVKVKVTDAKDEPAIEGHQHSNIRSDTSATGSDDEEVEQDEDSDDDDIEYLQQHLPEHLRTGHTFTGSQLLVKK